MVTAGLATSWPLAAPGPALALDATQLGVVVNTADPYSVEIGDYYVRRRGVPRANIVFVTLPTGQGEIGRSADSSFPSGTAYLLSTSDRARNTRAAQYGLATALDVPVRVRRIDADALRDRQDVLFYFTG